MPTGCGGGLMAGTLRLMSLKLHSHFILSIRSDDHRTRTRNGPNKLSQMTEIAKRLNAIIAQIVPFLSQEFSHFNRSLRYYRRNTIPPISKSTNSLSLGVIKGWEKGGWLCVGGGAFPSSVARLPNDHLPSRAMETM
ncbi:transducin-like enhancer protein 3-A [Caerostris extrusa]|uniref:Transducin-like enhancer protein 3-A n=1 Tax=Caerostris extrusa TaxID=172846 RepID=A0AAV4MT61_CAEEX|nr:transducin-like enhancer protein 3-A [Caerostris extrusa]